MRYQCPHDDAGEIEGEVAWLRQPTGVDEGDRVSIAELARRYLGGEGRVRTLDGQHFRGDAFLAEIHGLPTIFVRAGLSIERRNFGISHEVSERRLDELWHHEDDREIVADGMAAGHLPPRRALGSTIARGATIAGIARYFQIGETCAALRLGEALGRSLAIVTPRSVRVRGEPWGWPTEREIRRLGEVAVSQLRRVEIGDAPGRLVLVVG